MQALTGLIGRDALVEKIVREVRKGRHIILTGTVGVGKSALLEAVLARLDPQRRDRRPTAADAADGEAAPPAARPDADARRRHPAMTTLHILDHQAKGQFVAIARGLLESGVIKPSSLDLPEHYDELAPADIEWAKLKRHVNRLSIRDLTAAIVPAIHAHEGPILIAVDDLTDITPTLIAFWLAILAKAQVIGCASQKKQGLAKLWWKMTEIEVPPLPPEATREIVSTYIKRKGMLIEAPELFTGQVVKQSGGNVQAVRDMLDDASKERRVDKRKIREMRHQAGLRYLDFTPVMIVATALIVGTRYLAIGLGDTALYILAGMVAALVMALRMFLFRGAGKAN